MAGRARPGWSHTAVALVGVLLGLPGCGDGRAEADAAGEVPPEAVEVRVRVHTASARLGHAEGKVTATGTVRPWREANLRAEVGGRVESLAVDNGMEVSEGDLLLRVDGSRQQIAVAASGAALLVTEEDVERAREHFERMQGLRAERAVSKVQLEQAEHDYERAKAALEGARAEVRSARRQKKDTQVRAPIDGLVTRRAVDQGDTIVPGAPLLDLVDLSKVRVTVGVTGRDLARLAAGQRPEVRINDLGGKTLAGAEIAALAPSSNPQTGLFEVELHAANPEGNVRGGMIAAVTLELDRGQPRVLVPRDAITRRGGQLAVFEIVEGRARLRPVQTGGYDADVIEIVEGLDAGAVVATSGLHTLAEGVSVAPMDPGEATVASEANPGTAAGARAGAASSAEAGSPAGGETGAAVEALAAGDGNGS